MEKIYLTMKNIGFLNLILGAFAMIAGLYFTISGLILLKRRNHLVF